jgi:RimJ/RimL family protein N-acetyltransferase
MKKKKDSFALPTLPGLIGKTVYLRPAEPDDLKLTYQWFLKADPQSQSCRQIILATPSQAAEKAQSKEPSANRGEFIIVTIEENQPVGKVVYFELNMLNRSAELGYIVDPAEQGNGYAGEGLRLLINYLFNQLNLNKVYAQTATFNKPSVKLLESLDFKLDGTLRQHHFYKGDLYDDLVFSLLKFECSFL